MKTVKWIMSVIVCAIVYIVAIAAGFVAGPMVHEYLPEVWAYVQNTAVNVIAVIYNGDAFAAAGLLLQLPWIVNMAIGLVVAAAICMMYAGACSKN